MYVGKVGKDVGYPMTLKRKTSESFRHWYGILVRYSEKVHWISDNDLYFFLNTSSITTRVIGSSVFLIFREVVFEVRNEVV